MRQEGFFRVDEILIQTPTLVTLTFETAGPDTCVKRPPVPRPSNVWGVDVRAYTAFLSPAGRLKRQFVDSVGVYHDHTEANRASYLRWPNLEQVTNGLRMVLHREASVFEFVLSKICESAIESAIALESLYCEKDEYKMVRPKRLCYLAISIFQS
jgi:hypothetical protein